MPNLLHLKRNNRRGYCLRTISVLLALEICVGHTIAGDRDFSPGGIPKELIENANAVMRFQETTFKVLSEGRAVLKTGYAITILNEKALMHASLYLQYDKFMNINDVKGSIYDASGKRVERAERDRMLDVSSISGYSVYEDNRAIWFEPRFRTCPFTVEYSYEIVFNGIFDYPDYHLVNDYNIAVESAVFTVEAPDSLGIRYLERNIKAAFSTNKTNLGMVYSWDFSNVKPMRNEIYSPPIEERVSSILLAPNSMKIKKLSGSCDTWKAFGTQIGELIKDRGELSEGTKSKIREMISGAGDNYSKIEILYEYLQNKTRYASISIGLGGWQPMEAEAVDRLSYGDCKALTNFMQSVLKTAAIESYYALVLAGDFEPDIIGLFPANQFNHVFLCIPDDKDTLWLECTSQHSPMGYLGTHTDDRTALLIKEDGGYPVHTTVYNENVNIRIRNGRISLFADGSAEANVTTRYGGFYYDNMIPVYLSDDKDKRKKLEESIRLGSFKLDRFEMKEYKSLHPEIEETLNISLQKTGIAAGDLMVFTPNQFSRKEALPATIGKRINPVFIRRSYSEADTIHFSIPESLNLNGNPINEAIESEFGKYYAQSSQQGNEIKYTRHLVIYKGSYPKESYPALFDFFEKVAYADNKMLALGKSNR
jgi:hypothetical protein